MSESDAPVPRWDRTAWIVATVVLALLGLGIYVAVNFLPGRAATRRSNDSTMRQLHDEVVRRWNERSRSPGPVLPPP